MQAFRGGLKSSQSPFAYCVGGHPAPQRPQSQHAGAWTGVAMISKHPTRPLPVVWKKDVYQTSRVQVTTTLLNDMWITGGVIYGEPPGISHPFAKEHNEQLLQNTIEAVVSVKGLRFVAGDWNFQLGQLDAFQYLRQNGFQDIQTIAQEKWGKAPVPTCKGVTRKDFLFISQELRDLLIDVKIEDDIWADHSVLAGVFQGGPKQVVRHLWKTPQPFPWPEDFGQSGFVPNVDFENQDPTPNVCSTLATNRACSNMCTWSKMWSVKTAYGRGQTLETVKKTGSSCVGITSQRKIRRCHPTIPWAVGQACLLVSSIA